MSPEQKAVVLGVRLHPPVPGPWGYLDVLHGEGHGQARLGTNLIVPRRAQVRYKWSVQCSEIMDRLHDA